MNFYIDTTLYSGAPANLSERLPKEVRTYELLDSLQVPYSRLDHDETASIESCMEVEKLLGIHICKNLFLCNAQKTKFYMLMMPGNKKFKTKNLSKQINSARLSFAEDSWRLKYETVSEF